jgi:hypothetical protein
VRHLDKPGIRGIHDDDGSQATRRKNTTYVQIMIEKVHRTGENMHGMRRRRTAPSVLEAVNISITS